MMENKIIARHKIAFRQDRDHRLYWIILLSVLALACLSTYGLLVYNNPVPVTSASFLPVVRRRINSVIAMLIAALCQSVSTVSFHSITGNRVITPSLLGFESVYTLVKTSIMFFLGSRALLEFDNIYAFIVEVALMVLFCYFLFGWLLAGKKGNLQFLLLVGVILGGGLRSLSTFMRTLLAPSEFDILQAQLFASVNHADANYFPIVIPVVVLVSILLYLHSTKLNTMSLGRDVSINLGLNHKRETIYALILLTILMAISTALVGPMTFYGFLVASLAYQFSETYDHRYIYPMAMAIGFLVLTAAYFVMNHIFNAQGSVSILIEMLGGSIFILSFLRKGTL